MSPVARTVRAAPMASLSSGHPKKMKQRGLGRPPSAQTEGTTAAQQVPTNPEEAATDINPLNDGPCGDLWSGNCWVSQTLLAGSLAAGAAIPILIFRYCDSVSPPLLCFYLQNQFPPGFWSCEQVLVQAELQLFLWGCLLGLTWEALLSAPGFMDNPSKLLRLLRPASLLQLGIWSAWDGGICMVRPAMKPALQLCAATITSSGRRPRT